MNLWWTNLKLTISLDYWLHKTGKLEKKLKRLEENAELERQIKEMKNYAKPLEQKINKYKKRGS